MPPNAARGARRDRRRGRSLDHRRGPVDDDQDPGRRSCPAGGPDRLGVARGPRRCRPRPLDRIRSRPDRRRRRPHRLRLREGRRHREGGVRGDRCGERCSASRWRSTRRAFTSRIPGRDCADAERPRRGARRERRDRKRFRPRCRGRAPRREMRRRGTPYYSRLGRDEPLSGRTTPFTFRPRPGRSTT